MNAEYDDAQELNLSPEEVREVYRLQALRMKCAKSHLFFMRWFFKIRQNTDMLVNWHHVWMSEILDDVIAGKRKNVVFCVPPGASKTELGVINMIPRGLALNPYSRFLHISAQDTLASLNSQTSRDIVASSDFQELWQMKIASDSNAKSQWNVMDGDKKAGGVYAAATGGQIIGFRAGYMMPGFSGAILLDDLLKADDAFSLPKKKTANRRLAYIVKTRKAHPDVPVVLIMQRLAVDDPVGFILGKNVPGEWEVINIPALITDAWVAANLPPHIQALVEKSEKDAQGRYSYWPYKERLAELLELEKGVGEDSEGNRINRFMFASQYMQSPIVLGGGLIEGAKFVRYTVLPKLKYRKIYVDTAQKTKEHNDWSVFAEWGLGVDNQAYLLNRIRGRWEAPELKRKGIEFWNGAKARNVDECGQLRGMDIEDKASGTGLIQELRTDKTVVGGPIPVTAVQRNKDKLTRAMDILSFIDAGYAHVPADATWLSEWMAEHESFTADDTHAFDDQVDTTIDAIIDLLGGVRNLNVWANLIGS